MRALILAAGFGSRLGNHTKFIPKPMLLFKGKPILEHNILMCRNAGIKDILINLHHCPHVIESYFGTGDHLGVNINYSYEKVILGTAGAVKKAKSFLKDECFFVVYGDNYFNYDLKKVTRNHLKKKRI